MKAGDEEITDDEFEALLDQLHGSGQGPTKQGAVSKAPEPPVDKAATEAVQKAKQAAPAAPKATPAPQAPQRQLKQAHLLHQKQRLKKMRRRRHQLRLLLRLQYV